MRNKEKEVKNPEAIGLVLGNAAWGALTLVTPEGRPFVVPVSFVYFRDRLFFHSARAGEKMAILKARPEASFLVVDTFSKIPSYLFDPNDANAGITVFRSVIVQGHVSTVNDLDLKAAVLQAFMSKYQPEGGYEPITASSPTYSAVLRGVAILEIVLEQKSGKFGLGQKLGAEAKASVMRFLEERGTETDRRTLEALAYGIGPKESDSGSG